jgi:5'-nucleotidase/UDP-sugar diphosphatase
VPGNHEFDFGAAVTMERTAESKFEWLCSNINLIDSAKIMTGLVDTKVVDMHGIRVGLFGLCTHETLFLSSPGNLITFTPFMTAAQAAMDKLHQQDVDVIIALTHLSFSEDKELAKQFPSISLILGGHDHSPVTEVQGETLIHKSGHDAHYVVRVELHVEKIMTRNANQEVTKTVKVVPEWRMILNKGLEADPAVHDKIVSYTKEIPAEFNSTVAVTETELDSRTDACRSHETTMGNLVADAMLDSLEADIAICNAGTIRGDSLYRAGTLLAQADLVREFPFPNGVIIIKLTGKILLDALEQGLSKAEKKLGAFPQLSRGCKLIYSSHLRPGNRIESFTLNGVPISPEAEYKVALTEYIQRGGDGYSALKGTELLPHPKQSRFVLGIVMDYLLTKEHVAPKLEGRIVDSGHNEAL